MNHQEKSAGINRLKPYIIILLAVAIAAVIYVSSSEKKSIKNQNSNKSLQNQTYATCIKAENCCLANDDCQYIWYTGGCNTPEYVAQRRKELNEEQGITYIGEAPYRENVTCSCENNKCVTHN